MVGLPPRLLISRTTLLTFSGGTITPIAHPLRVPA